MLRFDRLVLIAALTAESGLCQDVYFRLASNFGSSNSGQVNAVTRDAAGALYVAGQTAFTAFATPGAYQPRYTAHPCGQFGQPLIYCSTGTVAKYSAGGRVLWATYLGGTNQTTEDHSDTVDKVLVDSHGNVWVSGHAATQNFPITSNAYQTTPNGLFLAELSPDGSKLLYSTYTNGELLAIDQNDSLYLGDISKFDPSTNKVMYTVPLSFTAVAGVVDTTGTFFVAGYGPSAGFPVTPGAYSHPSAGTDVELMAIDSGGGLIFSTAIGGSGNDVLTAMTRDAAGNFYLAGIQQALPKSTYLGPFTDFPVTPDALQSSWNPAFLLKLSPDASSLLYSTFLGKSNVEIAGVPPLQPTDLKVGTDGKLRMMTGSDQSDIALTAESFQPCYAAPDPIIGELQRWTYLQFSSDLSAIEYATAVPDPSVYYTNTLGNLDFASIVNGPFYFDATGTVYSSTISFQTGLFFRTLDISQRPHPGPVCLADYVTQTLTPADPGLLVSIIGPDIGPDEPIQQTFDAAGQAPTQLAGIQVLFGDIPAPILSASPSRIDAVVPFDVPTSGTTTISVLRDGNLVGTITNALAQAAPKLFTVDGTGFGAAAWNQDGTPNSASNPAHVGDIVSFWGTGLGVASLRINQSEIGPEHYCQGTYLGPAPGLVHGIFQFNCRIVAPFDLLFGLKSQSTTAIILSPAIYTLYTK